MNERTQTPHLRRACRFALGVAFLLACCAIPRTAFADSGTTASAPRLSLAGSATPFGWSNAVADFNADGRPDVAVADRLGRRGSSRYRIDVRLSGKSSQLITFLSTVGDVRIRAIDVDHDHDLDLVATPLVGQHVIGVWLNDGYGHFVESHTMMVAEGDLVPRPAAIAGGAMVQLAVLPPPRRLNFASRDGKSFVPASTLAVSVSTADLSSAVDLHSYPSSPRGPPAHFSNL